MSWMRRAVGRRSSRAPLAAGLAAVLAMGGAVQLATILPTEAANGSGVATVTVTASPTTVSPGSPVTFTASVSSGTGGTVPTGSVTFFFAGSPAQVIVPTDCTPGTAKDSCQLDAAGTASMEVTQPIASGTYEVQAAYSGDSNYARVSYTNSTPATFTVTTITVDNTTTTLQINPASITTGQSATLTATVVDQSNIPVTSGTVTFFNLTTNATVGTATLDSNGQASFVSASWPAGTFDLEATYQGPISFGSSAGSAQLTVTNAVTIDNTTTTLTISPAMITAAQSTLLQATVVDQNNVPVTSGTVTFFNLTTNSAIGTVDVTNGTADMLTGNWPSGTFDLEATYQGPVTMAPSGDKAQLAVLRVAAGTTTTVTSVSPASAFVGQAINITASVTSDESTSPSGTVTFYANGAAIGTGQLSANETAALSLPSGLAAGSYEITASYGGDRLDKASPQSNPVPLVVNGVADTTTTASASPSPSVLGSAVTLSATVSSPAGSPSGTVTFTLGSPSGEILCTATVSAGSASCPTSALPAGDDTVVASYGGDSLHHASSATTTTTVDPAPSLTTASATPSAALTGTPVTLSATVAPAAGLALTPSGTVTFSLGSAGGTTLCSTQLSGGTGSCTTSSLPAGDDTVVASYGGDSNFQGSSATTSASISEEVVVDVSGSQEEGSSEPVFTYTGNLPSGVSLSGTLSCGTVDSGTAIDASLTAGSYTIDGSSCSGLSAPNVVVSYLGVTDGYTVVPAPGTCSTADLPSATEAITGTEHGDITVQSGDTLYIAGGDVSGKITLLPGAALVMTSGTIGGDVTIGAGDPVSIFGGTVEGGISTTDSPLAVCGGTVDGKVEVDGGTLMVDSAELHGGIWADGAGWVVITGATISGDVTVSNTTGTPPAGVSKADPTENYVCSSVITGQLDLSSNPSSAPFEVGTGPDCSGGVTVTGGEQESTAAHTASTPRSAAAAYRGQVWRDHPSRSFIRSRSL